MRIDIIERNYQAKDYLREIIEKKVSKLDKYFDEDDVCKVYLKKENKTYKMEITIDYKGNFMRAEVQGDPDDRFYDTIDMILPKIERQIHKHRTKFESKLKKGAFADRTIYALKDEDLKPNKIVKTKTFDMEPMSVDEAIAELDLLGHTFYVFLEEKSNAIRVIYRRDDGDVGLIVPRF